MPLTDQTRVMEHLAFDSPRSLREVCEAMARHFHLPEFAYDFENETEWGIAHRAGIEFNLSRPFRRGTLSDWDGTVPAGCTFGLSLIVSFECSPAWDEAWTRTELAPCIGQGLADLLGRQVYHHRAWLAGQGNVPRKAVFAPARGAAK